jgi:uncharacterized membrane protein YGL010W
MIYRQNNIDNLLRNTNVHVKSCSYLSVLYRVNYLQFSYHKGVMKYNLLLILNTFKIFVQAQINAN